MRLKKHNFAAVMKNFILMFSIAAFVFTGCKKKEDPAPSNNNNNTAPSGVLVCKVNGVEWQSDAPSKMAPFIGTPVKSTMAVREADTMTITGIRIKGNDSSAISFVFVSKPGLIGTYNLSGLDYNGFYMAGLELDDLLEAAFAYTITSTIEITKYDATSKKMSGKFTITMIAGDPSFKDVKVTEGSFTDLVIE